MAIRDKKLEQIAMAELGIDTFEKRYLDSLDFYDCSINSIERALTRAFDAGKRQGGKKLEDTRCPECTQLKTAESGCSFGYLLINESMHSEKKVYKRISVGSRLDTFPNIGAGQVCPTCNAGYGQHHHCGCENERCPYCKNQLIDCKCDTVPYGNAVIVKSLEDKVREFMMSPTMGFSCSLEQGKDEKYQFWKKDSVIQFEEAKQIYLAQQRCLSDDV